MLRSKLNLWIPTGKGKATTKQCTLIIEIFCLFLAYLWICKSWAAKGSKFQDPSWLGSWRMCGTAIEKIISDNQRSVLELAALIDKFGFSWKWMKKIGSSLLHWGRHIPCPEAASCMWLSINTLKKVSPENNQFVPKGKGCLYDTAGVQ